jgi:hypothetical protein
MSNKLKRNYIQLVTNPEEVAKGEAKPKFDTYLTPSFIPLEVFYETIEVMEEVENMEAEAQKKQDEGEKVSAVKLIRQQMDTMMSTVIKIYGGQFDLADLKAGMHAPNMQEELRKQVEFIASGQQDEATKKFVESKS